MNPQQQAKIKKFVEDQGMSFAVKQALLDEFLKEKPNADYHVLAASRLAIDMLNKAWRNLEKYKVIKEERQVESQPGL